MLIMKTFKIQRIILLLWYQQLDIKRLFSLVLIDFNFARLMFCQYSCLRVQFICRPKRLVDASKYFSNYNLEILSFQPVYSLKAKNTLLFLSYRFSANYYFFHSVLYYKNKIKNKLLFSFLSFRKCSNKGI